MGARFSSIVGLIAFLGVAFLEPAAAQEKVRMAYLLGSSGAPAEIMRSLKLGERHGVEIEYRTFQDIAAMDRAFVLNEIDIHGNLALNQWAAFLNQGHDIVGVMGALHPPSYVVVKKDSAYRELKDLLGKRVGVYGLNGTSTAILGVLAHEILGGVDIRKSMELFNSSPPILATLLGKGEVEAVLNLPPFVPRMLHSGDYRSILDTDAAWKEKAGSHLPFAVIAASRKTIEQRPKAVQGAVNAWRDAVNLLKQKPELLNDYLAKARLTTPGEQKLAQEMMIPQYMSTWTPDHVAMIKAYWKRAVDSGFLDRAATGDGWYKFDFAR
ncbi:MAG: ABC transporter substrate-binding protein [Lautropia sp.]